MAVSFIKKKGDFEKALLTLEEALQMEVSQIVRDGTLQRFEYTAELFWKMMKVYLSEKEGIETSSPGEVIRHIRNLSFLTEDEAEYSIKMIRDRNLSSHVYSEGESINIYNKIPNYTVFMRKVFEKL